MKFWLAAGVLLSLASGSFANDGAVVQRVDGNKITFIVGLSTVRLGERLRLSTMPLRKFGDGIGTVTDIDVAHHLAGVVADEKVKVPLKLFERDVVYFIPLERFVDTYPDFKVDRPIATPETNRFDIPIPDAVFFAAPSGSSGSGASGATPGTGTNGSPGARPSVNIPDLENLLRSLPTLAPSTDIPAAPAPPAAPALPASPAASSSPPPTGVSEARRPAPRTLILVASHKS